MKLRTAIAVVALIAPSAIAWSVVAVNHRAPMPTLFKGAFEQKSNYDDAPVVAPQAAIEAPGTIPAAAKPLRSRAKRVKPRAAKIEALSACGLRALAMGGAPDRPFVLACEGGLP